MKMALSEKKPVIFVTDDTKEDWWHVVKGKTQGPRPDLVKEFVRTTGQEFHMYTPAPFLEFASKKFNLSQSSKAVDEARRFTEKRRKLRERLLRGQMKRKRYPEELAHIEPLIDHMDTHASELQQFIFTIQEVGEKFLDRMDHPFSMPQHIHSELSRIVSNCPCIVGIIRDIQSFSSSEWHVALDKIDDAYGSSQIRLAQNIRQLPKSVYDLAVTLLDRPDQSSPDKDWD